MAQKIVTDADLTRIANAIRTKGGTSESLVYPDDFVSAIGNISTGTDVSDTTATAGDVLSGKYFYTASGTKTQGNIASKTSADLTSSVLTVTAPAGHYASDASKTLTDANLVATNIKNGVEIFGVTGSYQGGGGGGLEYETGTYTPASDIEIPTIYFSKTYTEMPAYVLINNGSDLSNFQSNSNFYWFYIDSYRLFGEGAIYSTSARKYGEWGIIQSGATASAYNSYTFSYSSDNQGDTSIGYPRYFVTESGFKPGYQTSRYWRYGQTYKWIAVWAPPSNR